MSHKHRFGLGQGILVDIVYREIWGGVRRHNVIAEMPGGDVMDVGGVKEDFVSVRSDGGEIVMRNFCSERVPNGLFNFMRCSLFRHAFGVICGLSSQPLAIRGV